MSDLPKVVWTSPDGRLRTVFRGVTNLVPEIEVEIRSLDALGSERWIFAGRLDMWAHEIIADMSGVKWREGPNELSP